MLLLSYIGPGAGFAVMGSFLILFVALALGLLTLFSLPFRLLIGMFRRRPRGRFRRCVIVGFDGMDPRRACALMDAGRLPNLARLRDAGQAYAHLQALLAKSTLPNLFDDHPPFQIDGNFGGTAGIAEMLLQSRPGEVRLLPTLPAAWPTGSVRSLCARGGFTLDFAWANSTLTTVTVTSRLGTPCILRHADREVALTLAPGASITLDGTLT